MCMPDNIKYCCMYDTGLSLRGAVNKSNPNYTLKAI